jgi:hypothetical protein
VALDRHQHSPHRRRRRTVRPFDVLAGLLFAGAAGIGYTADGTTLAGWTAALPGSGCNIKGNISIETGERIYHVPGQKFYSDTRISPQYGERWFCSEPEARHAGWRKSKR